MLVRECLHKAPVTVPPECTLTEAAGLMGSHGVGALLVVSGDELKGIVTDRDIVVRGIGTGTSPDSHVVSVMTEGPTVIQGSADIFEAFQVLRRAGVRRLPVVEDGVVAGIITFDDLLVWLVLELGAVTTPVAGEVLQLKSTA
ncbi:MAG TPA: CBS domain-containing protein [Acidimicrobiales bacterium]|nr:CBS domain-containing protein [Acidimicrobiales bacterium]